MNDSSCDSGATGEVVAPVKGSSLRDLPLVLGVLGVFSGLIGLLAWIGYGIFAMRGIHAVISRDHVLAHHMAACAGGFTLAQLMLGVFAVGLGWVSSARDGRSRLAQGLGASAVGLGVVVLLLLFFVV